MIVGDCLLLPNAMMTSFIVDSEGMGRDVHGEHVAPHSRHLSLLLAISHRPTIARVQAAVKRAAVNHTSSLTIWRNDHDLLGTLIAIRPARENGRAVISLINLDKPVGSLSYKVLVELFQITRAEAEIALALFHGLELGMVADARNVQLETVRGQVKSLLRKLGVGNQKQLNVLLCRLALALPVDTDNTPAGGLPQLAIAV